MCRAGEVSKGRGCQHRQVATSRWKNFSESCPRNWLAKARDLSENPGYPSRPVKRDSNYLPPRITAEHATLARARRDWLRVDALALLLLAALVFFLALTPSRA